MQKQHYRTSKYGKMFPAGYKKKRVVIGGDPHSGKSTFMVLLKRDLKEKGINVELIDLDYSSRTVDWLEGADERAEKQPWTTDLAEEAKYDFRERSRTRDITLGDFPGRVSKITRILAQGVNGAIVLARDKQAETRWVSFFRQRNIKVISIIYTELNGVDQYYNPKYTAGQISGLDRDKLRSGQIGSDNLVIESVSYELARYFGLTFKTKSMNNS